MTLAAWRGQEALASQLIARERRTAREQGIGRMDHFASYAASVLYNGIGRYDAAHRAVRRAFEEDRHGYTPFVVPEVAEAASRTGDMALPRAALEWIPERTSVTPIDWALTDAACSVTCSNWAWTRSSTASGPRTSQLERLRAPSGRSRPSFNGD